MGTPIYPTAHSRLRLELAREVTSLFLKRDDIIAVVVGGSVGRGCADEYSDLEICPIWTDTPTPTDRCTLFSAIGTPVDDETVLIGGSSMIDAFKIDFIPATLDEVHEAMEDGERFGELRNFLWACVPIHNPDPVKNWQRTLRQQFEVRRLDWLKVQLRRLVNNWEKVASTPTDEYIICRDQQADIIAALINIICLVHHELANVKWIQWSISQVEHNFTDLHERLWSVFDRNPTAGFEVLRELCLETLDFIAGVQNDIGLDAVKKVIEDSTPDSSIIYSPKIERCNTRIAAELLIEHLDAPWFAWNRAIFYAVRQEPCFFWQEMEAYADFVLRALCLTNGIKLPLDADPYLIQLIPHLKIAPINLGLRLERAFFTPPSEGLDMMHELIEETFDVLETNMPGVDCTESRYRFRHDRRKPWQKLPSL